MLPPWATAKLGWALARGMSGPDGQDGRTGTLTCGPSKVFSQLFAHRPTTANSQ